MAATRLGRWRGQDAPVGARPGAYITPIDDLARRVAERRVVPPAPTSRRPARATHVHVHLASAKTHDAATATVRDQRRAALLARLRQDGRDGTWSGEDGAGNPVTIQSGANGLEIFAPGAAEGDQAGSEVLGTTPPGSESIDSLRKKIAPRQVNDRTQQGNQLADYQKYLDALYSPQ
jgi:hypothetical protein